MQLQQARIASNLVTQGLLWLRLVNTSLVAVNVTGNIGTGGQQVPAAAGRRGTDAAGVAAAAALAAASLPGPCDASVLDRALLQLHAPSAFDMTR